MPGKSKKTNNHNTIKKLAQKRGGVPAIVKEQSLTTQNYYE